MGMPRQGGAAGVLGLYREALLRRPVLTQWIQSLLLSFASVRAERHR